MIKRSTRFFNSGLTLVELMTTLSVGLIVLGVGIPSISTLFANNQMAATTNDLVRHMHLARSESVKRQIPVAVCASNDGQVCANSYEWGEGWIVFTDDDGIAGDLDGGDEVIKVYLPTGTTLSITSDQKFVRYQPDGSMTL